MKRLLSIFLLLGLLAASPQPASANPAGQRAEILLARDWAFRLGDPGEGVKEAVFDDRAWERVALPHNWNRMGGTTERRADYQNVHGEGWYRRAFQTPADLGARRAWLQFDAASIVAEVWVNGVPVGRHAGAFARFRFDVTKALKAPGQSNIITVKVDNSYPRTPGSPTADISPMTGDWPMYGGLYRPVSLVLTAPAHIAMRDHGGPGVYARTLSVANGKAEIELRTRLENDAAAAAPVTVAASILSADGKQVAAGEVKRRLAGASSDEALQTLSVTAPRLWDGMADPYLYRVRVELRDARGALVDAVEQPLGIRTFRIDPATGFHLNGKPLALHGVSRHQDRPGKGWSISEEDIAEDMALIREIGANTIRLAHYQHAEGAYAAADRAGMVTWAEIPLVDRSARWDSETTTPGFAASAEQQLRELIRQAYNHPSIITWSIANEVNLEAAKGRGTSNARPLLEALQKVVHAEDPSRPATLADCCGSVPAEARPGLDTVAGITDVIGYNRYHGWYAPDVSKLGSDLDRLRALYPNQPISVSEYGAGGGLTQHSDDPLGGPIAAFGRPHSEEFQSYILEESWRQIAERPYLWASWVWNMFDFSNEQRLEGDLTDTNDKGLVTFDRQTRKDAFYFFKANWSREPFVHLVGRRHAERPYPLVDIKAYSNQPSAELFQDGRSLGTATCKLGICLWRGVALGWGANAFTAVAGSERDAMQLSFEGRPGLYRIRSGTLEGKRAADGALWGSDVFFTGGRGNFRDKPSMSRGAQPGPVNPVAGAADQVPYESWREGSFAYSVPVPAGRYRLTLHFFEPVKDRVTGDRLLSVSAEGKPLFRSIDIVREAGGAMRALARTAEVRVTDGRLDLGFAGLKGEALVSAVEIVPID